MASVTLRQRQKHGNGKITLYLDIFDKGQRRQRSLGLYLHPDPKTPQEKSENREALKLAEAVKSQKLLELRTGNLKLADASKAKEDFIDFFRFYTEETKGGNQNYRSTLRYLESYSPKGIRFEYLDYNWLAGFRDYLDERKLKNGRHVSQNTKVNYFDKVISALNEAERQKYIVENPAEIVERFDEPDPERNFLTEEEIKAISRSDCHLPWLKKAFLFGCLTGLRYGDIQALIWEQISRSELNGIMIHFTQNKTKGTQYHPINTQAVSLIGKHGRPEDHVLSEMPAKLSTTDNNVLREWMRGAGITKHITFHCSRHTYAVLQLSHGTDIYTLSKLLGHKSVKTTEIYANIVNKTKQAAVNKMEIQGLQID